MEFFTIAGFVLILVLMRQVSAIAKRLTRIESLLVHVRQAQLSSPAQEAVAIPPEPEPVAETVTVTAEEPDAAPVRPTLAEHILAEIHSEPEPGPAEAQRTSQASEIAASPIPVEPPLPGGESIQAPAPDVQPTAPEPAPPRSRGGGFDFETRFGRRWAVLLGGGAVSFGLFLLVRQSIQQGYFPASVRLVFAALFAAALCALAEYLRRRGSFPAPRIGVARHMPDIPSTFFGAGLAGLFAVVYAAYAVYDFVGATLAFAGMAAAALAGLGAALVYGPPLAILGYLAAEAVPFLVVGDNTMAGAAYVGFVGLAGYAAAWRGRWPRLENPAGLILLLWAILLRQETTLTLALVAVPAVAAAIGVSVLRLRPAAALRSWRVSPRAIAALLIAGFQGYLVATQIVPLGTSGLFAHPLSASVLGFAILVTCLVLAATATRPRYAAPALAATIAGAVAILESYVPGARLDEPTIVAWVSQAHVTTAFACISAALLAITFWAVHRTGARAPVTALIGAASASLTLLAGDLVLRLIGGTGVPYLALLALAQGAGLLAIARPPSGPLRPGRDFAAAICGSVGIGLVGLAAIASGLGDGPLLTPTLAVTALGAALLAMIWRQPLFATVTGVAAIPVLAHAGIDAARHYATLPESRVPLMPVLTGTLLPGLILVAAILLLRMRLGNASVREADRRWLGLFGWHPRGGERAPALSLALAIMAAGSLLLGALVATIRWIAYGDVYAPASAPTDIGIVCTLALSGALAALRLHRSAPYPALEALARVLAPAAMVLLLLAIVANPFVTWSYVGSLPVVNLLLLAYLAPAVLGWRLAHDRARAGALLSDPLRVSGGIVAIAGLLAYATCAVSQAFQGGVLSLFLITEAELWTHTVVWLLLGLAMLAYGVRLHARLPRLAAIGVVIAVLLKVTFVDMAQLTGAARAVSVIALGLVLLGFGMIYQRLAAREQDRPEAGQEGREHLS